MEAALAGEPRLESRRSQGGALGRWKKVPFPLRAMQRQQLGAEHQNWLARAYFGRIDRPKVFNWKTFRGFWVKERRKQRITLEYSSLPSARPLNSGTWYSGYGATAALLTSLSFGMIFFSLRTILRG